MLSQENSADEDVEFSNEEQQALPHDSLLNSSLDEELEQMPAIIRPWMKNLFTHSTDTKFGPYYKNNDLMIGNKKIEITQTGELQLMINFINRLTVFIV